MLMQAYILSQISHGPYYMKRVQPLDDYGGLLCVISSYILKDLIGILLCYK